MLTDKEHQNEQFLEEDNPKLKKRMSKNLSEERIRMRKLMGFTYEDNSHDILSEQNTHDSLIEQRKKKYKNTPGTQTITTPLSGVYIDGYWTLPKLPITKKLSKEEMSNILSDDMFVDAIQSQLTANKVTPISKANALKLSQYWVNRIKTNKKFNRQMRKSIAARKDDTDPIIKINVQKLQGKYNQGKIGIRVRSNTGTPKLKLVNPDGSLRFEAVKGSDISAYINNLNFDNLGNVQYLINKKKTNDLEGEEKWVLEESPKPGNFIVSTPADSGTAATTKKGGTKPITVPIPINFGDMFQVALTSSLSTTDIQTAISNSLNQGVIDYNNENGTSYTLGDIVSADIIGSASNSWSRRRISPTHAQGVPFEAPAMTGNDSSGQPVDAWVANMNFKQSPANQPGLTGNDSINAGYAWGRTQDIITAINTIQSNPTVDVEAEWRVTDSGGQTGAAGQFAQMTALVELVGEKGFPDKLTPGINSGEIIQFQYWITPMVKWVGDAGSAGYGNQKSIYRGKNGKALRPGAYKRRLGRNTSNKGRNAPRK